MSNGDPLAAAAGRLSLEAVDPANVSLSPSGSGSWYDEVVNEEGGADQETADVVVESDRDVAVAKGGHGEKGCGRELVVPCLPDLCPECVAKILSLAASGCRSCRPPDEPRQSRDPPEPLPPPSSSSPPAVKDAPKVAVAGSEECRAISSSTFSSAAPSMSGANLRTSTPNEAPENGGLGESGEEGRALLLGAISRAAAGRDEEEEEPSPGQQEGLPQSRPPSATPTSCAPVTELPSLRLAPGDPALRVHVSHAVSQNHFYVQRQTDKARLEMLSSRVQRHGQSPSLAPLSRRPARGEFLLARYSQDGRWYRCKVLAGGGRKACEVVYVDYGNVEMVPPADLKPLPPSLARDPAFAVECGMSHLEPVSEAVWKEGCLQAFNRLFCQNATYLLTPLRFSADGGSLDVDLALPPSEHVSNDQPVSAADIFAFLGFITAEIPPPPPKLRDRQLTRCSVLLPSQSYSVRVSSSEGPEDFHVHFDEQKDRRESLQSQLEAFYGEAQRTAGGGRMRSGPVAPGMLVACQDPRSKAWFRAAVTGVKGGGNAAVRLVDHGHSAVVSWACLFKLADAFLDLPEMARRCRLDAKGWCSPGPEGKLEAKDLFRKLTSGKDLVLRTGSPDSGGQQTAVTLTLADGTDVADAIGRHLREQQGKRREESKKPSRSVAAARKLRKPSGEMKKFYVTHAVSPWELWVRPHWLDRQWEEFSRTVDSRLAGGGGARRDAFEPGEAVAVEKGAKHYYRGKVVSRANEMYSVRLVDTGELLAATADKIWELPGGPLTSRNAFCHCVRMKNVRPAGGGGDAWSRSSTEAFLELVGQRPHVFLTLEGRPERRDGDGVAVLPVNVFYEESRVDDALEPVRIAHVNVASVLKERGLLLAEGPEDGPASSRDESENPFLDCGLLMSPLEESPARTAQREPTALRGSRSSRSPASPFPESNSGKSDLTLPAAGEMWPSPLLPGETRFSATVTYVDDEGQLYLQTPGQAAALEALQPRLAAAYDGKTAAATQLDLYWRVGDLCVARYPDAEAVPGWFRGVVTAVGEAVPVGGAAGGGAGPEAAVAVLYVDYGETKVVYPGRGGVHKVVPRAVLSIPIQVLRCKLDNIVPAEDRYSKEFLDDIHREFVETEVDVEIKRRSEDARAFPLPVFLHSKKDGQNLARLFISKGASKKITSRKEWFNEEIMERQEKLAFGIQPQK